MSYLSVAKHPSLGHPWIERLIALRTPIVFDLDDAIYLVGCSGANWRARMFRAKTKIIGLSVALPWETSFWQR